jgi:hypothetical protein
MQVNVKMDSGATGVFWAIGYFILLACVHFSKAIAAQYPIAIVGWTGGLVSILTKNHANNKLDVQAAVAGNGTVESLNQIKLNAAKPCAGSE